MQILYAIFGKTLATVGAFKVCSTPIRASLFDEQASMRCTDGPDVNRIAR
jgi:hypothetical protein